MPALGPARPAGASATLRRPVGVGPDGSSWPRRGPRAGLQGL